MKLLHCTHCGDILRILGHARTCECGDSEAVYVDNKLVYFSGPARILAIDNNEFVRSRPGPPKPGKAGFGPNYRWWVIGEHFDKAIKRVEEVDQEPSLPPQEPRVVPAPTIGGGGRNPFPGYPQGEMAQLHFEETLNAEIESGLDAGRGTCLEDELERVRALKEIGDAPDDDPWFGFPPTDM